MKDGDKNIQWKCVKFKYMDEVECFFNIKVLFNVFKNLIVSEIVLKKRKKDKFCQVIIYEFEKMMKFFSFFKNVFFVEDGVVVVEFVEGKGWIDM